MQNPITVTAIVNANVTHCYKTYLDSNANSHWNTAGEGWTCGGATVEPVVGGKFSIIYRGPGEGELFDFEGTFTKITPSQEIQYTMHGDGRQAQIIFKDLGDNKTEVTVNFEAEGENTREMQEYGWGNVLNNFRDYAQKTFKPNFATLHKEIIINANPTKIWNVFLEPRAYTKWTAPFCDGQYYECEKLQFGSKICFKSPQPGALESLINVYIPGYRLEFKHQGFVEENQKSNNAQANSWYGYTEQYTLLPQGNSTKLTIYQELQKDQTQEFSPMWDKALAIIKELAEN